MKLFTDNRNYKTIVITERQAKIIREATDGNFSTEVLNGIGDIKEKVKYCIQHLGDYIGAGSSRVVFQIDDEKVFKLAYNDAGVEQNIEECKWANGEYSIFPKIYDYDAKGNWIISEFVLPAKKEDFDYFLKKYNKAPWIRQWSEFVEFIWSLDAIQKKYDWRIYNDDKIEVLRKNRLFDEVYDYVMSNNVPIGDLTVINNWGLAKRNGDAMPVILDAGWRNGLHDEFYGGNNIPYIDDLIESKRIIVITEEQMGQLIYHC